MRSLIVCKLSARKTSASCRFVIISVFEGGVGVLSGGRLDKSIDMFILEAREVGRDDAGDVSEDILESLVLSHRV